MTLTYYGHSCFDVSIGGKSLLFDPFITHNELARGIDIETIPADYILVSHGHEDHVADAESIAKRTGATLISNFEIVSWFGEKGITNGHPMNHGGSKPFDFGTVKYVNAVHSSVLPDGSYGGNPGGFVITSDEGSFYYAGDTALTMDMKLIGDYMNVDFAILPIGNNFTMGAEDASICCEMVKVKKAIGMHFDTFPYIAIDTEAAKRTFEKNDKELIIMEIGQTIEI
jgi:L-ascorbate metabolism protein UlaG (beta-lactamase superfamily)